MGSLTDHPYPEKTIKMGDTTKSQLPQKATILKVDNGFIIEVGCKTFIGNSWSEVSEGLELFFSDPKAAKEKYCK